MTDVLTEEEFDRLYGGTSYEVVKDDSIPIMSEDEFNAEATRQLSDTGLGRTGDVVQGLSAGYLKGLAFLPDLGIKGVNAVAGTEIPTIGGAIDDFTLGDGKSTASRYSETPGEFIGSTLGAGPLSLLKYAKGVGPLAKVARTIGKIADPTKAELLLAPAAGIASESVEKHGPLAQMGAAAAVPLAFGSGKALFNEGGYQVKNLWNLLSGKSLQREAIRTVKAADSIEPGAFSKNMAQREEEALQLLKDQQSLDVLPQAAPVDTSSVGEAYVGALKETKSTKKAVAKAPYQAMDEQLKNAEVNVEGVAQKAREIVDNYKGPIEPSSAASRVVNFLDRMGDAPEVVKSIDPATGAVSTNVKGGKPATMSWDELANARSDAAKIATDKAGTRTGKAAGELVELIDDIEAKYLGSQGFQDLKAIRTQYRQYKNTYEKGPVGRATKEDYDPVGFIRQATSSAKAIRQVKKALPEESFLSLKNDIKREIQSLSPAQQARRVEQLVKNGTAKEIFAPDEIIKLQGSVNAARKLKSLEGAAPGTVANKALRSRDSVARTVKESKDPQAAKANLRALQLQRILAKGERGRATYTGKQSEVMKELFTSDELKRIDEFVNAAPGSMAAFAQTQSGKQMIYKGVSAAASKGKTAIGKAARAGMAARFFGKVATYFDAKPTDVLLAEVVTNPKIAQLMLKAKTPENIRQTLITLKKMAKTGTLFAGIEGMKKVEIPPLVEEAVAEEIRSTPIPMTELTVGLSDKKKEGTHLAPEEESNFQSWYKKKSHELKLDPNPDAVEHQYDYRGYYKDFKRNLDAGINEDRHWPSKYKMDNHPNRFIDGVDTKTGKKATDFSALIPAIIAQESNYKETAVSPVGAKGLMQLMDKTGKWLAKLEGVENYDPFDPKQNVQLGSRYIRDLYRQFKDIKLALAAYNAGPGRLQKAIDKAGSKEWSKVSQHLPSETRDYVPGVLKRLQT